MAETLSLVSSADALSISGSLSGTPGATGPYLSHVASTFTDSNTAASGTATQMVFNSFAIPTLAASNTSVTTTDATTVAIDGAPTAGTNETITNAYALQVKAGESKFSGLVTSASGLTVSATTTAIAAAQTMAETDSGCTFNVAQSSAYTITMPTPASGLLFRFIIGTSGAFTLTFATASSHFYGALDNNGTYAGATGSASITTADSLAVGTWIEFIGVDSTHYLVRGFSTTASAFVVA